MRIISACRLTRDSEILPVNTFVEIDGKIYNLAHVTSQPSVPQEQLRVQLTSKVIPIYINGQLK